MEFFGTVRQKIFDRKSWYSPPLILKLFGHRKADETQHRRVPLWNSSALSEKKILTENRDTPSLLPPAPPSHPWTFSIPEIGETLGGSPQKFFGTVRQKIFDGKSWYSPFLSINFLATGSLMKHSTEVFPYGILRHCQTKNFWQSFVILPPSSHILPPLLYKLFRYLKLVKH